MRSHSTLSNRADSWGGFLTFFCRYLECALWILCIFASIATLQSGNLYWVFFTFVLAVVILPLLRALRIASVTWNEFPYLPSYQKSLVVSRRLNANFLGAIAILALGSLKGVSVPIACLFWLSFFVLTKLVSLFADDFVVSITRDVRKSLRFDKDYCALSRSERKGQNVGASGKESIIPLQSAPKDNVDGAEASESEIASSRRERFINGERIYGRSLVEFVDGSAIAVLHIPFCPPFEGVPTFDIDLTTGEDVKIKTTSVQPFGARLEASRQCPTLNQKTPDEEVWIDYFAEYSAREK